MQHEGGRGLIRGAVRVVAAAGLILVVWASTAQAQQGSEGVHGLVREERLEDNKTVRNPVPGVKLTISKADGTEVGTATTDAQGRYTLPLPGPGDYRSKLDESTLPKGVELQNKAQADLAFSVRPNEDHTLNYALGKDTRITESKLSQLPQTLANGLRFGLIIAICSVGLSLIYGTTGLANFAHG